jgi:hypothetical protein
MVLFMFKSEYSHKEFHSHLVFLLNVYYANDHFFRTVKNCHFKGFLYL